MFKLGGPEIIKEITKKKFLDFCQKWIKDGNFVLEIGPGDGSLAESIINLKKVDYLMFDINNQRIKKELKFLKVDVSWDEFPLSDNTYDIILSSQVLEHLENFSNFFKESYRVLKKGGYLITKTPNFSSIFQKMIFLRKGIPLRLGGRLSGGGHINFLTFSFLKNFLRGYFEPIEVKGDLMVDIVFFRKFSELFFEESEIYN